jgi:hypothetical protein
LQVVFYLIVLSDIIEHIENLDVFMSEVKRVRKTVLIKTPIDRFLWRTMITQPLGRSGKFGFSHPDSHVQQFLKKSLEKAIRRWGMAIIASKVVYRQIYNWKEKKNMLLKTRWYIDSVVKKMFPRRAHIVFRGIYCAFLSVERL